VTLVGFFAFESPITTENACCEFVFAIKHLIQIKMSAIVTTMINTFASHSHKKKGFHETAITDRDCNTAQRRPERLPQQQ